MYKRLCLVCPTDCLESIIDKKFRSKNYFYTSLGNSLVFDHSTMRQIEQLVKKYGINEILFVLSCENRIILDGLKHQHFSVIRGLNNLYEELILHKKRSEIMKYHGDKQFLMLSYYLNRKITQLQIQLNNLLLRPIEVTGKIYKGKQCAFNNVYSGLACMDKFHFN